MKRKTRRLERKLTTIVDGNGRAAAESIINTQFRELLTDIAELIAKAVRRNPENPWAELGIDKSSARQMVEILAELYGKFTNPERGGKPVPLSPGQKLAKRTAIAALKRTLNRIDVCYLVSVANMKAAQEKKLTTLRKRVSTVLENGVRVKWDYSANPPSALPSSKQRKFVPNKWGAEESRRLRENAKLLNGRQLQTKVLNVVELRLQDANFDTAENAVRITNALHSTLRQTVDMAVDTLKANPAVTGKELESLVYRELSPKIAASRNFTKTASRAIVSSSLNVAILDETERLVAKGLLTPQDFFLNRPAFLYKAVMDLRTSDICRTLNGLIIPLNDKARLIRYIPPQHANCRSILIPNLRV